MVVSPDVGGVVRARAIAARLHTDLAIIDKRRERAGMSEVMNVIGEVEGRHGCPKFRHGRPGTLAAILRDGRFAASSE